MGCKEVTPFHLWQHGNLVKRQCLFLVLICIVIPASIWIRANVLEFSNQFVCFYMLGRGEPRCTKRAISTVVGEISMVLMTIINNNDFSLKTTQSNQWIVM